MKPVRYHSSQQHARGNPFLFSFRILPNNKKHSPFFRSPPPRGGRGECLIKESRNEFLSPLADALIKSARAESRNPDNNQMKRAGKPKLLFQSIIGITTHRTPTGPGVAYTREMLESRENAFVLCWNMYEDVLPGLGWKSCSFMEGCMLGGY